jgi:branched-chain amino acid aminotransferase
VGFDSKGVLTEGSTENIILVDHENHLVRPKLRQILRGTTMMRALHLANDLVRQKLVTSVTEKDLHEKDIQRAKEVMMVGTTLDVLPVTEYEGKKIGDGNVGRVAQTLRRMLVNDME